MSVLSAVLDSIRGKRQQHFATTVEKYDALVLAVARGQEADVDAIAEALDQLDRSDSDFSKDVTAKERRLAAFSNLKRWQKTATTIPALQAKVTELDGEITAYLKTKRPALAAASEKLTTAQREAERVGGEEQLLRTVGISLATQNRQRSLALMLADLQPLRQRYNELTSAELKQLPFAEQNLEDAKQVLARHAAGEGNNLRAPKFEVDRCEKEVSRLKYVIGNAEHLRVDIAARQAVIDAERAAIEAELMVP